MDLLGVIYLRGSEQSLSVNTATIVWGSFKLFELSIFEMLRKALSEIVHSILDVWLEQLFFIMVFFLADASQAGNGKYFWWSVFASAYVPDGWVHHIWATVLEFLHTPRQIFERHYLFLWEFSTTQIVQILSRTTEVCCARKWTYMRTEGSLLCRLRW